MTSRNEHRANKRAGLVHACGWIVASDWPQWCAMRWEASQELEDYERKAKDGLTKSGEDQQ